jgi:hypothetical protein
LPNPWHSTAAPVGAVELRLDARLDGAKDPTANLSAAALAGATLFLGSDEGASLERLVGDSDGGWANHARVALDDLLPVSGADEADIEGLAEDSGWLWVLGSHARTRPKLEKTADERIDLDRFAKLKDTRSRCLLARLPLVDEAPVSRDGKRRAGMLRATRHGNALARRIAADPLLGPFARVAAKEGGVDLEGIAVAGTRVAIGMRGPVVQTYAVLLDFAVEARRSGRLAIDGPVHKRLLDLDGLGIRDLHRRGADLLILAGPCTGLDGPCALYRWADWLGEPPGGERSVRLHRPERVLDLPFGRGDDHPEGFVLVEAADGATDVLVVCDSPAANRLDPRRRTIRCDRFRLPAA